jgi:hypothetical protein
MRLKVTIQGLGAPGHQRSNNENKSRIQLLQMTWDLDLVNEADSSKTLPKLALLLGMKDNS